MSARVFFLPRKLAPEEMRPRLAAGRSALINRDGRTLAYLLEGNRVRATPVRIGATFGDLLEILSGLKAGERVVVTAEGRKDDICDFLLLSS